MSNPHDYTVGWICAIPAEYVAAQNFLDAKHEGPDCVSPNDNNDYTLGQVGKHNVVIAVLPNCEYGLSSAASVARDMLHSFPNVRIGLLVGIGSGAPTLNHDIRLGDVVVGVPHNGKGGIIQYDFGKIIQGQEFQEAGFLNQPPTLLRTAVHGLMTQYESDGNQIREAINSVITKKPRLRKKYMRPEATTDRLYWPQVVHPSNNDTDCTAICGDDPSNLIKRSNRDDDDDDDPAIHYGLIASASTLIRDASIRDEMAKNGVLCFETEAAGLVNHFPCLVIRGICDYSDSHANEKWHGYAAMTAAAYAKDLLSRITPNRVEAETKISNILSGLYEVTQQHRDIAQSHLDVAESHLDVAESQLDVAKNHRDIAESHRDIAEQQSKDSTEEKRAADRRKCHQLFRITSDNRDATYEWYKDRIDERVKDTCLWFLNHKHYQKWLQQTSGPLLVTADPGCGKSVLAKYLIDHSLSESATTCYFFFKDQDQNTLRQALCALLHQLFSKKPSLIEHAMEHFDQEGEKLINSTHSLWHILRNATNDPKAGPITIVLDALDECAELEFADLIRNVERHFSDYYFSSSRNMVKYFLTCRPYEHITSQFHALLREFPNIRIPGEEESESISQEVNRVITHRIKQLSEKKKFSPKINSYLEKKLQETTHRTYLWVYLVFNYLEENVLIKRTQKEIESIITKHPKNVNEAYEKILNRSEDEYMVRRALSIILAASRPLTLSEMNIAMNINDTTQGDTTNTFDDLDLEEEGDFKSRLRTLCGLFISIYHRKVYFLHQTAREFLLADLASPTAVPLGLHWHKSITSRQSHNTLAELCVLYLNLFNSGVSSTMEADGTTSTFDDSNAFLNYSAENWATHFREAQIIGEAAIISIVLRIYDTGLKSCLTWLTIYQKLEDKCPRGNLTELIIASYYGHHSVVKLLIENGADIEAKDDEYGRTPILWAAMRGYEDIVKLLAENGADIEAECDKYGETPLIIAIEGGHENIVKLLIEKGADIEAKDNAYSQIPLIFAIESGHENIVKLLIEKGADIEAKDDKYSRTPLISAADNGHENIVKLLIEKGAGVGFGDRYDWAVPRSWLHDNGFGNICIVDLPGEERAGAGYEYGRAPLSWLAASGNEAIVKLLVEKGFDIESRDRDGRTLLSSAATEGHYTVVKLLIENGADLEATDDKYRRSPILWAALKGHENIVKLLIKNEADVESKDTYGQTLLSCADWESGDVTAKLSIEKGADINVLSSDGETPPTPAAEAGHETILQLLAEKGYRIKARDYKGRSLLLPLRIEDPVFVGR